MKETQIRMKRIVGFLIGASFLVGVLACPSSLVAQKKHNPDSDIVKAMVDKALLFLGEAPSVESENKRGDDVLRALTICEATKRYEQEIPRNHPRVVHGVELVLEALQSPRKPEKMENDRSIYFPALSLILLCEYDDIKYANEIRRLIKIIESRQGNNGAFCYLKDVEGGLHGDISQSQYGALALFVAKHHRFKVNLQVTKKLLEYLASVQEPEGGWHYRYLGGNPIEPRDLTLSIGASGMGTVYLLADMMQLNPRVKNMMGRNKKDGMDLPPSVSAYVKPKDGQETSGDGPLVNYDGSSLASVKGKGNSFFKSRFTPNPNAWGYYYLYAFERYAFFREQAEGSVRDVPDWYDQGVDFLRGVQQGNGGFPNGRDAGMTPAISTSLAVLFLVRSSQILVSPGGDSTLKGGIGFQDNVKYSMGQDGALKGQQAIKGIDDVDRLLSENSSYEEKEAIISAIEVSVSMFEGKSRAERVAYLNGMAKDQNYFRRLIGVRILSKSQDMDNVPALLYALDSPDRTFQINREAHNGLRLISRKIDSVPLSKNPTDDEFRGLKDKWTDWFLKIRPDAELLD